MAISAEWGTAPDKQDYFGLVDYQQNLSRGYDSLQILDYLNNNLDKLRGVDLPGGGRVYDMAVKDAANLRIIREQQATQQNQVSQFEDRIAEQQKQFAEQIAMQQKAYEDTLLQQQQYSTQQQQSLQQQFSAQQRQFSQQLAARQKQAEEAQRQLMIGLQQREKQPAEVRMATSSAERSGLARRGTSGYFGRKGLRIGSLNVPNTGMSTLSNSNQPNMAGSFA